MFNFVSSFLCFVKVVIVGDNEPTGMTGKKFAKRLVYGLFVIFAFVSYNSSKNLYYLSKHHKVLKTEHERILLKVAETQQCSNKLQVREESLRVAIAALQDKCPTIVYVDKHCDITTYGNFQSTP